VSNNLPSKITQWVRVSICGISFTKHDKCINGFIIENSPAILEVIVPNTTNLSWNGEMIEVFFDGNTTRLIGTIVEISNDDKKKSIIKIARW